MQETALTDLPATPRECFLPVQCVHAVSATQIPLFLPAGYGLDEHPYRQLSLHELSQIVALRAAIA